MPETIVPKDYNPTQQQPPGFATDEIEDLIGLLEAYSTMSAGRWDQGMTADQFASVIRNIQQQAQRAFAAATRMEGHA